MRIGTAIDPMTLTTQLLRKPKLLPRRFILFLFNLRYNVGLPIMKRDRGEGGGRWWVGKGDKAYNYNGTHRNPFRVLGLHNKCLQTFYCRMDMILAERKSEKSQLNHHESVP